MRNAIFVFTLFILRGERYDFNNNNDNNVA